MKSRVLMAFLMGSILAGCDLPRDPEETLETVQGQELRVGVLKFGENAGNDRPIVERLAGSLGSKLVYVEGDAHALFEDLKCLVAERCWDRVRWAIEEYTWRFDGSRRPPRAWWRI